MTVFGPDFIALQTPELERSVAFYEGVLGLRRADLPRPGAVVFATEPIPFAVREPLPGVDVAGSGSRPGIGVALWFGVDDTREVLAAVRASGAPVLSEPTPGPFGLTASFADPDGYVVTIHERG